MPKKSNSHFPTRASLIEATFKAITGCGGSATNDEIQEHVIEILELPDHIFLPTLVTASLEKHRFQI